MPVAASVMLLSTASALIVWRCLRPLDALRSFATSFDPERPAPMQFEDAPLEFGSVIDLINQLVTRLVEGREAERRLTRNAGPLLRTPIAAQRVQAADLGNGPVTQRDERPAELQQGVDRLASPGSQLLVLPNAEEAAFGDMVTEVALRRAVYDVVASLFPFAVKRDIDLGQTTGVRARIELSVFPDRTNVMEIERSLRGLRVPDERTPHALSAAAPFSSVPTFTGPHIPNRLPCSSAVCITIGANGARQPGEGV